MNAKRTTFPRAERIFFFALIGACGFAALATADERDKSAALAARLREEAPLPRGEYTAAESKREAALDRRLESLERLLETIDGRLGKLDDRMGRIEKALRP